MRNWLASWRLGILASWHPSMPPLACHSCHPSSGGSWEAELLHNREVGPQLHKVHWHGRGKGPQRAGPEASQGAAKAG